MNNNNEWTILAGFVVEDSERRYRCVSFGTGFSSSEVLFSLIAGTKCLGGKQLRKNGSLVNDGHAEVSLLLFVDSPVISPQGDGEARFCSVF